jgi:ABC-type multidrug transport system ATPase subunit
MVLAEKPKALAGVQTLSINNIEVTYSGVILVLRGVSFKVEPGQIVSLLGPNGAGKSTTLKSISGLLKSETGEVTRGSIYWGESSHSSSRRPSSLPPSHRRREFACRRDDL